MPPRLTALLLSGAALGLVAPAAASAGTVTPTQACYTHIPLAKTEQVTQPVVLNITGGTPGGRYQVRAGKQTPDGGVGSVSGDFDAAGNAQAALLNVFPPSSSIDPLKGDTIFIAVKDYGTNTDIATGTATITNTGIAVAKSPRNPYSKRTIRISGLTPLVGPGTLYGSYVSGKNGTKVVKRVKLGTPNACGYLKVKRVLPPKRGPHTWTLYVHTGKKLDKDKSLFYSFKVYRRYF